MNESKRMLASIIAQDIAKNPATLIAVNRVAARGENALKEFIMSNAVQALRNEPTAFPNPGMAVRALALEDAGMAGLGAEPEAPETTKTATSGTTAKTPTAPSTWSVIGDLVGSLATAGTAIYVNREQMKLQEDLLKQQQQAQATAAEAQAQAMIAQAQQTQQVVHASAGGGGVPVWAIAGGVGVLALGGFMMMKKR